MYGVIDIRTTYQTLRIDFIQATTMYLFVFLAYGTNQKLFAERRLRNRKKKIISDAITNISTEYIEKAAAYTVAKKSRKPVWLKWGAMAACLCLVIIDIIAITYSEFEKEGDIYKITPGQIEKIRSCQHG